MQFSAMLPKVVLRPLIWVISWTCSNKLADASTKAIELVSRAAQRFASVISTGTRMKSPWRR